MRTLVCIFALIVAGCAATKQARVSASAEQPLLEGGSPQYQDEIQNEIRKNISKVKACYEDLLKVSPKAQGKIVMRVEINRSGKVNSAKIKESTFTEELGKADLDACAVKTFTEMEFPKFQSAAEFISISYPVNLRRTK